MLWAVEESRSRKLVGMINYHHREPREKRVDVGWLILPKHQGKGFMTEAGRALLLASVGIVSLPLDAATASGAADLRARYGLRTPDAVQIATAIGANKSSDVARIWERLEMADAMVRLAAAEAVLEGLERTHMSAERLFRGAYQLRSSFVRATDEATTVAVDKVAADRVLYINMPVQLHSPWDMTNFIEKDILVGLD